MDHSQNCSEQIEAFLEIVVQHPQQGLEKEVANLDGLIVLSLLKNFLEDLVGKNLFLVVVFPVEYLQIIHYINYIAEMVSDNIRSAKMRFLKEQRPRPISCILGLNMISLFLLNSTPV